MSFGPESLRGPRWVEHQLETASAVLERTAPTEHPSVVARPAGARLPLRVLELRSVRGTGGGPEKTILLGAARSDPSRVDVTVCYIRDRRDDGFRVGALAGALGVSYVELIERHSFDPRAWFDLARLVRDRHIDIVHAHDYKTDLMAYWLASRLPVRPIATVHGWIAATHRARIYRFVDRRLLVRYPLVIAVSQPIRRALIARGADPRRIRHVRNGIDTEMFRRRPEIAVRARERFGIPAEALVLGAVGRLEPEKRFDLLIETADRLAPIRPFVVIAGEGSERRRLEAIARDRGLADRLRLLGHRTDVVDVHHLFDVYVQSSETEGSPNAVLEAMAIEVPVVATDVGGTSEIVENGVTGLLVRAGDVDALARAVAYTIADRPATSTRVAAARARVVRELSFDARQAAVERLYLEMMTTGVPT